MRITDGLSPKKVFYYFEEISKIPRGSGNTKAISDYCVRFAESHGFKCLQDDSNNCIIFATAVGCDKAEPILLAGHLDMVCEKAPDCTKDMEKEGIDLAVDGVNISARSMGALNVQVILEPLGGGGHLMMAGAQLQNCTLQDWFIAIFLQRTHLFLA